MFGEFWAISILNILFRKTAAFWVMFGKIWISTFGHTECAHCMSHALPA